MPDSMRFLILFGAPLLGLFLAAFVHGYVAVEHPAYIWDSGTYFIRYEELGALARRGFHEAFTTVFDSIRSDDYNSSSIALLLPVYLILGPGRAAYVWGIVGLFLIPAVFVAHNLFYRVALPPNKFAPLCAIFSFILFFPPFWQATVRGMPDIVGLVPLGIAAIVIMKTDYLSTRRVESAILVGALLWSAFVLRRYYAYTGISILVCGFLFASIRRVRLSPSTNRFLPALSAYSIAGITAILLALTFQSNLISRIVTISYSEAYAAYQLPVYEQFARLYFQSGILFAVPVGLGLVLALFGGRHGILFLASVASLAFFLFSRIQSPSVQHGLPFFFFLMPAALLAIYTALHSLPTVLNNLLSLFICVVTCGVFFVSFSPGAQKTMPLFSVIAPRESFLPLFLPNYPEYERLLKQLHTRLDKSDTFAVFSSSPILADSLLYALDRSLLSHIAWASQVDERDGFGIQALRARYAIIATPTPTHLPEKSQQVITVPAEMIRTGRGIGADYRQIDGPYQLAYGHVAMLYERTTPLSNRAIQELEYALRATHQDWTWDGMDRIAPP